MRQLAAPTGDVALVLLGLTLLVGPANLPAPIVKLLSDEINKLLDNPELRDRLSGEALEPMPMSPDEFSRYIRDDITKWSRVAKERNISIVD